MRIIFLSLLLVGCANVTEKADEYGLTVDEYVDARNQAMLANWQLCEHIYEQNKLPTYHEHKHDRGVKPWMIREDLINHGCRSLLARACVLNQKFECSYWRDI